MLNIFNKNKIKTLREYTKEARENKKAIGHFNVSNLEGVYAIFEAAKSLNLPVIVGVSEGERDFVGVRVIASVIKKIREENNYPIFLNADHTYSVERVKEAIDAGYDMAIYDGAEKTLEENILNTKECVKYAKSKNKNILIEAEMGYIGKSSKVLDKLPEGINLAEEYLTNPSEAKRFVLETGVDLFAPAVGNIHGMFKGGDPDLNIRRVREISEATNIPLVLHGASGNSDSDIKKAIESGVAVVHVNTELRVAFKKGILEYLEQNPTEVAPYKYLKAGRDAMQKVVLEKLKVFNQIP